MELLLGSLFDGIGAFPRTAELHGIVTKWASEIEPFPIKVTSKRFPNMKHLGDITKVNGAEIEPVDIISFGSPCQDMSVAGKRAGLEGERSGLFMEAVRIIKEMREATNGKYPRFALWENVPGAFSSNSGRDFRAVLEEITEAEIPIPPSGRWAEAGLVRVRGGVKLHGESSTLNIGVSPSEGKESSLSQILEGNVLEKYFLSEKACLGILRRAEKRGKKLPPVLEMALMQQAGLDSPCKPSENTQTPTNLALSSNETTKTLQTSLSALSHEAKMEYQESMEMLVQPLTPCRGGRDSLV